MARQVNKRGAAVLRKCFSPRRRKAPLEPWEQSLLRRLFSVTNAPPEVRVQVTDNYVINSWLFCDCSCDKTRAFRLEFIDRVTDSRILCNWLIHFPEDADVIFERLLDTRSLFLSDFKPVAACLKERLATGLEDFLDRIVEPWYGRAWYWNIPSDRVILENRFPDRYSKEK